MTFRNRMTVALAVFATVAFCTTASAAPFNNAPPFAGAGPNQWPNHPNSRHLDNDATNDALSMITILGPEWDVDEWACDEIIWNGGGGQAMWYEDAPETWPDHQGLVGIDNSQGSALATGSIAFHINNFEEPNYIKYFWDEIILMTTGTATITANLTTQAGATVTVQEIANFDALSEYGYPVDDPGHLQNLYAEIQPNPEWEEITYTFNVGPGEEAYIDSFEFATICVPEPAALMLLLMACVGLAGLRPTRH